MSVAALLLVLAQATTAAPDYDRIDIPTAYRGIWALDAKFCGEPGPALVTIGARRIDFWERHGFLQLAQLNEGVDPPEFHGSFQFVELLHFTEGVVRLEMKSGRLFITEAAEPDARTNPMGWTRCG